MRIPFTEDGVTIKYRVLPAVSLYLPYRIGNEFDAYFCGGYHDELLLRVPDRWFLDMMALLRSEQHGYPHGADGLPARLYGVSVEPAGSHWWMQLTTREHTSPYRSQVEGWWALMGHKIFMEVE
jgi:hypothetical protein